MNWKSGFKAAEEENKRREEAAASSEEQKDYRPRRVWVKEGTTQRFLFVTDEPVLLHEHQIQINGDWKNWAPCLKKNGLADTCKACDEERWPAFVGIFTAMKLTPWTSAKGRTYVADRVLMVAKMGSKDKPGMLREIQRQREKHGRLRGLVFDFYRSGKKAEVIGDKMDLIDKIDPTDEAIRAYALKVAKAASSNYDEKYLKIAPLDIDKLIVPHKNAADFEAWMRGGSPSGGASSAADSFNPHELDSSASTDSSDDIPY